MSKKLVVMEERCPKNHRCPSVRKCPEGALLQLEFSAPKIDYEKCILCGKCVKFCPKKVLVFTEED